MPAIPVLPSGTRLPDETARVVARPGIFERGDHVYLTSPVQVFTPTDDEVATYAFSSQVKSSSPNENIAWFKGQYVEADNPNGNGAQWKANELAIKSLTPRLMPVTVMHDPRTAVGTIADAKLLTPDKDGVPRARIDTVLALWGHRFPEAVEEAALNAERGTLMQSMECHAPWYECSVCGQVFHKLPLGAERALWCSHLTASNPSGGYTASASDEQSSNASRILGDVCFTGTGLIFGTRGARGAYSEAYLEEFQDEVASFHATVHTSPSTTTSASTRSNGMGLVQIEDSELATLRKERDDARAERDAEKTRAAAAEQAAEAAETAKVAAEAAKKTAEEAAAQLQETAAQAELKEQRWGSLGDGFIAKLGDFTKGRLQEQAKSLKDDEWDNRLKELEEVTAVKRDAKADGSPGDKDGTKDKKGETFTDEEVARLGTLTSGDTPPAGAGVEVSRAQTSQVVGKLSSAFAPKK